MKYIDRFDVYVGEYLALLYENFPVRLHISTLSEVLIKYDWYSFVYIERDDPRREMFDQSVDYAWETINREIEKTLLKTETLTWLYETKYFDAEVSEEKNFYIEVVYVDKLNVPLDYHFPEKKSVKYYLFDNARLTPKGLEALRSVPKSLSEGMEANKSLGELLYQEAQDVATQSKRQLISQTVGEVIGFAVRSMNS